MDERMMGEAQTHEAVASKAGADWCVEIGGERYAGRHLLIEFYGAKHLDNPAAIELALKTAAGEAGATCLAGNFHKFTPNGGVTGVLLLAESHISIHTWPEHSYAAIDVFMCGSCDPHAALPALRRAFEPHRSEVGEHRRGKISP